MKIKIEILMNDGTKKHEIIEAKNFIEAHQKMHKKYKGQYQSTLIDEVIAE